MQVALSDFMDLKMPMQAHLLWTHGTYLAQLVDGPLRIKLYQYHDYFAEIVYDSSQQEITEVVPFREGEKLDKFIDLIPLDDLYQ